MGGCCCAGASRCVTMIVWLLMPWVLDVCLVRDSVVWWEGGSECGLLYRGVMRGIKALFGGRRRVLWYGRQWVDSSGSW